MASIRLEQRRTGRTLEPLRNHVVPEEIVVVEEALQAYLGFDVVERV